MPEAGSVAGRAGDRDSDTAGVAFASWARPPELWRWGGDAGDGAGLERWSDLPSPVDPSAYVVGVDRYRSTEAEHGERPEHPLGNERKQGNRRSGRLVDRGRQRVPDRRADQGSNGHARYSSPASWARAMSAVCC